MDIRLNQMSIKNFKGIKYFRLEANGYNISIVGDNATCKTSCYDAFYWLISGKDSFNRSDFDIKPLDEAGKEIHFLEIEVEVELLKDGKLLKLKKVQTENWVKPHGKTEQEYKGNNVAYFFDDVPVGAAVYKNRIEEFIKDETFRLLTNPMYFNQYYKVGKLTDWQSRRMLLFEMCGETSDEVIIAANPGLAKLPEVLAGKGIDDMKAIIAQSIKKLNEQIEKVGPAINENMRLIPESEVDYTATEAELIRLKMVLDGIDKELSSVGNMASEYRKQQQELFSLKGQLETVKSRIYKQANSGIQKLIDEKSRLENENYKLDCNKKGHMLRINQEKKSIENNSVERQKLLTEWESLKQERAKLQESIFVEPDKNSFTCPTCGQDLPEEAREEKLSDIKIKFEKHKADELAVIENKINKNITAGKNLKVSTDNLQKDIEDCGAKLTQDETRLKEISIRLADIDIVLSEPATEPDYAADAEYIELSSKIVVIQNELDKPIEDTTAEVRQRKQVVVTDIENCNRILNNRDVVKNAKDRIEELKQSEREFSNQKSKLEGQLNLITEFIKAKANTLTDIMNSKFKHVRFRLFDVQENGGIVEVCDTLVNTNGKWVPFASGNTAGRINAGIDIVNALSEHFGVNVPVWVDNAESISRLDDTKAQVIRLVKPEIRTEEDKRKYSKLNVEVDR